MKKLLALGLGAFIALNSGCAASSVYNQHQKMRPAAAQSKALSTKALQIKASGEGQDVIVGAGIDWAKFQNEVSILDTFNEDKAGMSWAVLKDAIKVAALGYAAKYIDKELNSDGGEDAPTGPAIQASNGGRISVNNAPDGSYKDHTLKANGQNSSIDLNFVAPEDEDPPFNLDGTANP